MITENLRLIGGLAIAVGLSLMIAGCSAGNATSAVTVGPEPTRTPATGTPPAPATPAAIRESPTPEPSATPSRTATPNAQPRTPGTGIQVQGVWVGTAEPLHDYWWLELLQSDNALTGTLMTTPPAGAPITGTLAGVVSGAAVRFVAAFTSPALSLTFNGAVHDSTKMSGEWSNTTGATGTITLTELTSSPGRP